MPGDRISIVYSYIHIVLALRFPGITVGYYRVTQKHGYHQKSNNLQKVCTTKTLCFTGAQKCAPNELPGAVGTFGSGGQSSR